MLFTTSRGELTELRMIEANLIASLQHFYDKPEIQPIDEVIIKIINISRLITKNEYITDIYFDIGSFIERLNEIDEGLDAISKLEDAKEKKINKEYHCLDKHILVALIQTNELIEAKIRESKDTINLLVLKRALELTSSLILTEYMGIMYADLKKTGCFRCLEDFLKESKIKK